MRPMAGSDRQNRHTERSIANRQTRNAWLSCLLAFISLFATGSVHAELLDELLVVEDADGKALELRFQRSIVYQRHSPTDEGSLVQVYFQPLMPEPEARIREEFRRVDGDGVVPATTVTHSGRNQTGVHLLTINFGRTMRYQIGPGRDQQSLRIRFPAVIQTDTPRWRILLSTTGSAITLPSALQNLPLRRVDQSSGEQWLMLGEFSERSQAQAILYQVQAILPAASLLEQNNQGHWLPVSSDSTPVSLAVPESAEPLDSQAAIERYADTLMQTALSAMTAGEQTIALDALNRLLNLPPNGQSEDAQELIGVTREQLGDRDRAKIEYELFLKLYPGSERRQRVEQRLQRLQTAPTVVAEVAPAKSDVNQDVYGSVLQTWFEGNSKIDTETSNPLGNTIDRSSLSLQDQRSLLTSFDFNVRRRSANTEQRWVLRDAYLASYLDNTDSRNRLYAAYWDYRDRDLGWSLRAGRQSSQVGGVLGRFDGMQVNYDGFTDQKLGIVVGQPADTGIDETSQFTALFAEQRLFEQRFSNQLYAIRNDRTGITTREAFGDVISYIGQRTTWYGMVDYDSLFGELNIATLQGSWQYLTGGYVSWMLDRRKTPVMDLGNALIGEPVQELGTLIDQLGEDTVMQYARDRTADADGASLNVTYPLNGTWQLGLDARSYRIGETPASGNLPASPGTGNVVTIGAQVIGSHLFSARDSHVWSVSQIHGERYDGWSIAYTLLWPVSDSLTVEPSLRYYDQKDESGATLARWTPTLRLRYQFSPRMVLELQYDGEQSLSETDTISDRLDRQLWSIGYVWEF